MPDAALDAAARRASATLGSVVVAFSGGADSAFLAWVAHDTLGPDGALAVTAVSPSLPAPSATSAARWPPSGAWRWQEVETDELDNPAYARNDGDRCYWCKDAADGGGRPAGATAGAPPSCSA